MFILVAVESFKVSSKIDVRTESESIVTPHQRSLDPPSPDHEVYDVVFAGQKKPLMVDCTQPGIICKFPVVVTEKEGSSKPIKQVKEVPIVKGSEDKAEGREDSEEKEEVILKPITEEGKVPIFKGSYDVESLTADKDIEETWILEKNILNKKYQIPVKLLPSKHHSHGVASIYPTHHDFHDHYNGGDMYHFPSHVSGSGWSPWMRAYPSVYNYPSHQPCEPPVYRQPPPCRPAVAPTRKPTINIDDKVDKEED